MKSESWSSSLKLSDSDRACLHGSKGAAAAKAMEFLVAAAPCLGASRLISISHCHLVGSYYCGPTDLTLLQHLVDLGAQAIVPTTLNASSACLANGSCSPAIEQDFARKVVDLYVSMTCDPILSCAPYHLPQRPEPGDRIAWAESNAVIFANSVLGARTNRTVQYLDLCAAITGRIPESGLYCDRERHPTCVVDCGNLPDTVLHSSIGAELLGLWLGYNCGTGVPLLVNCSGWESEDLLRGLGAAAASSGAVSLFHVNGITPEADQFSAEGLPRLVVSLEALKALAAPYLGTPGQAVGAICLGAPHYSLDQLKTLAYSLVSHNVKPVIPFYVTTSRYNRDQLQNELLLGELSSRGIELVVDTCSFYGRAIPPPAGAVLTDSAKWAYYGGGNLKVHALLGDLHDCLTTASSGRLTRAGQSIWL